MHGTKSRPRESPGLTPGTAGLRGAVVVVPPNRFESEVESFLEDHTVTAPITSNRPTTTRLHHYAGRHSHGSGIPVETFFTPAWGASTPVEIFFAHAHPKWLIFDHFHLAGAIFLSQRHPKLPPGATQGRSFFHTAPRDDTESPPVWRAPRGVEPGRGAGGRWLGLAGLRHDRTPSAAGVEGAGGSGGHGRASRSTTPSRRLACGDLAGGRALRRPEHQRHHTTARVRQRGGHRSTRPLVGSLSHCLVEAQAK